MVMTNLFGEDVDVPAPAPIVEPKAPAPAKQTLFDVRSITRVITVAGVTYHITEQSLF